MKDDPENPRDELDHDEDEEGTSEAGASNASPEEGDDSQADPNAVNVEADARSRKGPRSKAKRKRAPLGNVGGASKVGGMSSSSRALLFAAIALIGGATAGWFARDARAKTAASPESDPAAVGSAGAAGPCKAWEQKVCDGTGAQSVACMQAHAAGELLSSPACDAALADVPATLAKVKAARVVCDTLVKKLCTDLGKQSPTCKMVEEKTMSIPPDRCKEMLANYDAVIGQLRSFEQQQQGGPQMGGGMRPMPQGPQGMPPGAAPHP